MIKITRRKRKKVIDNIIESESGLLDERVWHFALQGYRTELVCAIRQELIKRIPDLKEKFNPYMRYFGYWRGTDKDRAYIYVQKKNLLLDVCIDPAYITDLRNQGFRVEPRENFQGTNNWLTGWKIPQDSKNVEQIVPWICKAFQQS